MIGHHQCCCPSDKWFHSDQWSHMTRVWTSPLLAKYVSTKLYMTPFPRLRWRLNILVSRTTSDSQGQMEVGTSEREKLVLFINIRLSLLRRFYLFVKLFCFEGIFFTTYTSHGGPWRLVNLLRDKWKFYRPQHLHFFSKLAKRLFWIGRAYLLPIEILDFSLDWNTDNGIKLNKMHLGSLQWCDNLLISSSRRPIVM